MSSSHEVEPLIELVGVRRVYDEQSGAGVDSVGLRIFSGEFVAILGPSGAGKSTLLNVLGLLDRPDAGAYLLQGRDVAQSSERERNQLRSRYFGFVFQSAFALGDETARRNAALGLRIRGVRLRARDRAATQALSRVGLAGRSDLAARKLSGGERQRLAIARALAADPQIVLADEPTGNLDTANSSAIIQLLQDLNSQGVTVVVVTHDEQVAAAARRVVRVADGRVREETAPEISGFRSSASEDSLPLERGLGRLLDNFSDVAAAMQSRLLRSTLLMLAFALGVGGLIAALGLSETASAQVTDRLSRAALDEVRVDLPAGADLLAPGDKRLQEWTRRIASLPHVKSVGFEAAVGANSAVVRRLSSSDPEPEKSVLVSSVSDSFLKLEGARATTSIATLLDDASVQNVAIVGKGAASALDIGSTDGSQTIWVDNRRVTVVGLLDDVGRYPQLTNTVLVSRDVIAGNPTSGVSLVVRTDYGFPATVADAIPLQLDAVNPGQFKTETVADLRNLRFGVANDLGRFVAVLAVIMLILAGIGAATTMYLSVQARAQEIALRRAIGASRLDVAVLFLTEGAVVGAVGGAFGAVVGLAVVFGSSSAQGWAPVLNPSLAPLALLLGVVSGVAAAVAPSVRASREEPAAAIRG